MYLLSSIQVFILKGNTWTISLIVVMSKNDVQNLGRHNSQIYKKDCSSDNFRMKDLKQPNQKNTLTNISTRYISTSCDAFFKGGDFGLIE